MRTITSLPFGPIILIQESISDPSAGDLIAVGRVCRVFRSAFRSIAGTVVLGLSALAACGAITPANLEYILRRAWLLFQEISREALLMPLGPMIAHLPIHREQNETQPALNLLWDMYNTAEPFTWLLPVEMEAIDQMRPRRKLASSYSVGVVCRDLALDTDVRPNGGSKKLEIDAFSRRMENFRAYFLCTEHALPEEIADCVSSSGTGAERDGFRLYRQFLWYEIPKELSNSQIK
ncbi:hypothetical protein BDW74DRAFT_176620 [Aspergillus multicolor]|uniref:uncharacterized protein n=1 Tax=Aspergillus multicolor TaxID=41759 RepID=UPI003CCD43BC